MGLSSSVAVSFVDNGPVKDILAKRGTQQCVGIVLEAYRLEGRESVYGGEEMACYDLVRLCLPAI